MFLRILVLIFLLPLPTFAAKDLILFVSASKDSPQIADSDYAGNAHTMSGFEQLVRVTNENLDIQDRPAVLHLEVRKLNEMASELEKSLDNNPQLKGLKIRMLFFSGHGNQNSFWLHDKAGYTGQEMAVALSSKRLRAKFNPDIGVYFGACNCGQSLAPRGFQMQFMNEFKRLNEELRPDRRTRSLVSLAHRYSSFDSSYSLLQQPFEAVLYKMGVFTALDNLSGFIFQTMGRNAANSGTLLITGAVVALSVAFQYTLGPEVLSPETLASIARLIPVIGIGTFFTHGTLRVWTGKWAREMSYLMGGASPGSTQDVASGNMILKMIKIPKVLTCERAFGF